MSEMMISAVTYIVWQITQPVREPQSVRNKLTSVTSLFFQPAIINIDVLISYSCIAFWHYKVSHSAEQTVTVQEAIMLLFHCCRLLLAQTQNQLNQICSACARLKFSLECCWTLRLLGCYATSTGTQLQMFWTNTVSLKCWHQFTWLTSHMT